MGRLLVSVRGPNETEEAANGGAHIADVEYPGSALGVATAGSDYIKCGMAGLDLEKAVYLGRSLVRTIKEWQPEKKLYPAVFPDDEYMSVFNPLIDGPKLVEKINCDGLLIDTYNKNIGKSLLDYFTTKKLKQFVDDIHSLGKEAWLAGSITLEG